VIRIEGIPVVSMRLEEGRKLVPLRKAPSRKSKIVAYGKAFAAVRDALKNRSKAA